MIDRNIICIGGGEIRSKTTVDIDGYIASYIKRKFPSKRPVGLFIGTASHDSMPYFNSFRKTYTSLFDIKADCALLVHGEMDIDKIENKIKNADFIYVGGGDTIYMMNKWREIGVEKMIRTAYENGTLICGLSAGAICWFEDIYTDSLTVNQENEYSLHKGFGYLKGVCCPHFELRKDDYKKALLGSDLTMGYGIEGDCALHFQNEKLLGSVSSKSHEAFAYSVRKNGNSVIFTEIDKIV